MKQLRTTLSTLGGIFLAALLIAALAPKAARGVAAALVQVANTSANPVPVTQVGALQPFAAKCFALGTGLDHAECSVTVPTGKRLVLEIVSVKASIDGLNAVNDGFVGYSSQGTFQALEFDLAETSSSGAPGGTATFVRTQPVTAYVDPGSTVTCGIEEAAQNNTDNSLNCWLVGYLVNQ